MLAAAAALGGGVATQLVQASALDRRDARAERHDLWAAKSSACRNLYAALSSIEASVAGAVTTRSYITIDRGTNERLFAAQVAVELLVSKPAWSDMKSYIDFTSMRANAYASGVSDVAGMAARHDAERLGATTTENVEAARERFVAAIRSKLAIPDLA
jgi:hypothetical protein